MLNTSVYPEKWHKMLAIVSQYPAKDMPRQYKYLVMKRWLSANVFTFLLQYIGLMMSTLLPIPSPVWFAAGAASATVFLRGYRVSTGIWLGGFTAYYLASHQFLLSCACTSVFVIQAILLTWITRHSIYPLPIFYNVKSLLKFSLYTALLTSASSFVLIWLCNSPYHLWILWWLANLNGVVIVAIAFVSADTFFMYDSKLTRSRQLWAKTARWAFILALIIEMLFYLNLSWVTSMSMTSIIVLQLLLCLGTLTGLLISIKSK